MKNVGKIAPKLIAIIFSLLTLTACAESPHPDWQYSALRNQLQAQQEQLIQVRQAMTSKIETEVERQLAGYGLQSWPSNTHYDGEEKFRSKQNSNRSTNNAPMRRVAKVWHDNDGRLCRTTQIRTVGERSGNGISKLVACFDKKTGKWVTQFGHNR